MAKITQYSRLTHHTITGSASATFSVPPQEDFTAGDWSILDLAISEIGVNEDAEKAFIRTGGTIKEIKFVGATAGTETLATTLLIGNNTGASDIIIDSNQVIRNPSSLTPDDAIISLGDTARPNEIRLKSEDLSTGQLAQIVMDNNATGGVVNITTSDPSTTITGLLNIGSDPTTAVLYSLDDGVGSSIIIQTELVNLFSAPAPALTTIVSDGVSTSISTLRNGISDHTCDDGIEKTQIVVAPKLFEVRQFDIATLSLRTELKVEDDNISLETLNSLDPVSIQQIRNLRTTTQTTDATPTTVFTIPFLAGASNINCKVKCSDAAITQGYAANLFAGFIFDGTTVTQLSTTDKVEKTTLVGATSDISFTGTDLIISVTGLAATTISWIINLEIQ